MLWWDFDDRSLEKDASNKGEENTHIMYGTLGSITDCLEKEPSTNPWLSF